MYLLGRAGQQRRLSAILAADVAGYTRLVEKDTEGTVAAWQAARKDIIDPATAEHSGRIVKHTGDGFLAEFVTIQDAVKCAATMQKGLSTSPLDFRMGINLGDVIDDGDDIHGEGVNIAARIEALAEPGGICISRSVFDQVRNRLDCRFEDLGEHDVKHVSAPVRVYRVVIKLPTDELLAAPTSDFALPDKPSVAVLPFDNMSSDPEQGYFSDGITEDIITSLSHMTEIFVIARNSSFTYKGSAIDVKRVGQDLGVRYVLEGSVRRSGDRIRVSAQLIDARSDTHVWADRYDGTIDDIFALQDDITAKIISAVGPEIALAEIQRARLKRSEKFDAWDRYLQALQPYYALDKMGYEEAKTLLQEAIELDPQFSTAHATLARCHVQAAYHGWEANAREAISEAEKLARLAIALDEKDPFAHLALGWIYVFNTEPGRAVNELNRALELNPNLSIAHGIQSCAFAFLGRSKEALAAAKRANRGSPRDPERYMWNIGITLANFAAERYEDCVEAAERAVLLQPNFYGGHFIQAAALAHLGRIEEARQAVQRALEVMPRLTLKNTARNPMFVRERDVEQMLDGLRQAGVPD